MEFKLILLRTIVKCQFINPILIKDSIYNLTVSQGNEISYYRGPSPYNKMCNNRVYAFFTKEKPTLCGIRIKGETEYQYLYAEKTNKVKSEDLLFLSDNKLKGVIYSFDLKLNDTEEFDTKIIHPMAGNELNYNIEIEGYLKNKNGNLGYVEFDQCLDGKTIEVFGIDILLKKYNSLLENGSKSLLFLAKRLVYYAEKSIEKRELADEIYQIEDQDEEEGKFLIYDADRQEEYSLYYTSEAARVLHLMTWSDKIPIDHPLQTEIIDAAELVLRDDFTRTSLIKYYNAKKYELLNRSYKDKPILNEMVSTIVELMEHSISVLNLDHKNKLKSDHKTLKLAKELLDKAKLIALKYVSSEYIINEVKSFNY